MNCVFIILISAKFLSIRCDDDSDCSEEHPENCVINGAHLTPNWETDPAREGRPYKKIDYDLTKLTIPKNFDARTAWPKCAQVISRIGSQGSCNNCWSFASTMAFADRVCIASNGTDIVEFSIVDLVNCCTKCLVEPNVPPCKNGGYLVYASVYAVETGMAFEECKPWDPDKVNKTLPNCEKQCVNKTSKLKYRTHKGTEAVYGTKYPPLEQIKAEIMTNGPVCGHMENLTDEFSRYWHKKEMYIPARPIPIPETRGGHAVRIIGWGVENDPSGVETEYWIIANSWGTKWADEGIVKFPMAKNDHNINFEFWAARVGALIKDELPSESPTESASDPPSSPQPGGAAASDLSSKSLIFTMIIFLFARQLLL